MEAYYDKDLKRWVFPGESATEVAAPPPPPPTTMQPAANSAPSSMSNGPSGGYAAGGAAAPAPVANDDPLAALMAPPPARRTGARSRYPDPLAASGNVSGGNTPSMPTGGTKTPPKFAVFTPVAK